MNVFFKKLYFSIVFAALYLSSNSVSTPIGEGVVKQKADMHGQGEGGRGLKTGKNVRTSFMDDPIRNQLIRNQLISSLVLDSLSFKKLLELHGLREETLDK